ncbi:histidine phosphatase family protein [Bosea sp. 685]|uniref:histidine phosphatase family protein n=1 Tax=Bosea sp. 685 TaxID=3080057 RepID=UPI002892BE66|nr:histidine phosphatase family protein [Bosea sp. 685]WNJ89674.1 histidine phosphatase family protein [Bosea sp. 685]
MATARYLSHPQVQIDPAVPVPDWGLSPVGLARTQAFAGAPLLRATRRIVSSAERKAIETAECIASALGITVETRHAMHENDRSATGYLPPPAFEAMADAFFASPTLSIRGWERALDAQARILREVEAALAEPGEGDILFVGHGGVGTLLLCHLGAEPIARKRDQPGGGGNLFAFDAATRIVHHAWRAMEEVAGQ